ncbi:unnamed protein product [Moneuplotes crassus]|uniref:Uncharacterized protein n=2 Tax=Euplotes crassus TaxID=5936 RepID=A0AAD2DCV8_EUPCR|nr:unnamed protein product [Moneuplotes crassus]
MDDSHNQQPDVDDKENRNEDAKVDLTNPVFYSNEKDGEVMKMLESDKMLQNMWPLVEEISKAVADESRDSEVKKEEEEYRNKINEQIMNIYNGTYADQRKEHKRFESLSLETPPDAPIAQHQKSSQSQIPDLIPDFDPLKSHGKCKDAPSETDSSLKKNLSRQELDSMINRLHKCGQVYNENKKNKKTEMEEELISSLSFQPHIGQRSKKLVKAKYHPIYDQNRLKEIESSKNQKIEKIKSEIEAKEALKKLEEDKILEEVASKTSSSKYNHQLYLQKINDYTKAYSRKRKDDELEKEQKYSDITFKPTVNKKSGDILSKAGKKSFTDRQKDYQEKNRKKLDKIKKDTEPSFQPRINKKSKKITKKIKQVSESKKSPRRLAKRDIKNLMNSGSPTKDAVVLKLDYDIDDSGQNLLLNMGSIGEEKFDELRDISDYLTSKKSQNEYDMTSKDAMDLLNSGRGAIDSQIISFNQEQEFRDLNEREEESQSQNLTNILEEPQNQSNIELNERDETQEISQSQNNESRKYMTEEDFSNSKVIQDYIQNELSHHLQDQSKGSIPEDKESKYTSNNQIQAPAHLDTVKEATIEETFKNDISPYEKGTNLDDLQEEIKIDIKNYEREYAENTIDLKQSQKMEEENSYLHSEQNSNKTDTRKSMVQESMTREVNDPSIELLNESSLPLKPREAGEGSLQLLDGILKQYKHCVK